MFAVNTSFVAPGVLIAYCKRRNTCWVALCVCVLGGRWGKMRDPASTVDGEEEKA